MRKTNSKSKDFTWKTTDWLKIKKKVKLLFKDYKEVFVINIDRNNKINFWTFKKNIFMCISMSCKASKSIGNIL